MYAYKVTATDTAQVLIAADNKNRTGYINVVGNKTVALGNASVTFDTGLQIAKHSAPLTFEIPLGETIYCICTTGETDDIRVLLPNAD